MDERRHFIYAVQSVKRLEASIKKVVHGEYNQEEHMSLHLELAHNLEQAKLRGERMKFYGGRDPTEKENAGEIDDSVPWNKVV